MKTNTVSNTAFRGFGGPQGLIAAERIMEEIGYALGKDPLEVRKANFYGEPGRNVTPYHQTVTDNVIGRIVDELEASSDYAARRQAVLDWNAKGGVIRKGIALTPVKFGISFTATWYNQAGALVHVYNDGSIHLNHGGTEMGQGLNTKVAQVVADCLPGRSRPGQDHRDDDGEGAEHLGDGGVVGVGPERHGGAERRRADQARG